MEKLKIKKTAQEIQDDIFRKMTANRKLEVASQLWKLGRVLNSEKINYARSGSKTFTR